MFPIQDKNHAQHAPIALWIVIGVNVLVFAYQSFAMQGRIAEWFGTYGMVPAQLDPSAPTTWGTLLSSQFLHGGIGHITANMWMLFVFGDNVEDRMGPIRFAIFYLACGVAAGLAHYAFAPQSQMPTVGASGAIAGVLGAYFLLFPRARVLTLVPVLFLPLLYELPAAVFLGLWFGLQILNGSLGFFTDAASSSIAWWAHAGGFVAGLALCKLFAQRAPQGPRLRLR